MSRVKTVELWDRSFEITLDGEKIGTAKTKIEAEQKALVAEVSLHRLTDPTRLGGPDGTP